MLPANELISAMAVLAVSGALAGFLAGLLGIGGGIVMVPALYFTFGFLEQAEGHRMHFAVATALAIIVVTSIASSRAHYRRGAFNVSVFKTWAPWIAIGSIIGVALATSLSSRELTIFFAAMAFVMGLKLVLPLDDKTLGTEIPGGPAGKLIPTLIGGFSAMMGIGGATFSVPAMTLYSEPIHRAVGTAALIGLVIALPASGGYIFAAGEIADAPPGSIGYVNLIAFAVVAPVSFLVAPLGAAAAHRLERRSLSVVFGIFLVLTATRLFFEI